MVYNDVLLVGADDSNHAGTNDYGEVNAIVMSFITEDGIVRDFPNRRDFEATRKWLKNSERDYRFTLLFDESYRHSSSNLVYSVPRLVEGFLEENDLNVKTIKIFLDGQLKKEGKEEIRDFFSGKRGIEKVVIDNFIKKNTGENGKKKKHITGPSVLYYADVISSMLYRTLVEASLINEKLREIK